MKSYIGTYCLLLGACLALTGCGVATGVGATVGVASAQEGGLPAAATDLKIQNTNQFALVSKLMSICLESLI